MNRNLFWLSFLLWLAALPVMAQPHISQAFILEQEWSVKTGNGVFQPQGMVGCLEDDMLYCCHRRGFQNKENGYYATISAVDLLTGQTTDYLVPLPEKKASAALARKYWIRGIRVEGNKILLSVQNAILVYQKGKGSK